MGAALNAVGDRWALLIVRDLMLGPRRYSDLLRGLGGIGTDILAARLRGLEDAGLVTRRRGDGAQSYELTTAGRALRPVLVELARWGADRLEFPDDPSEVPPRVPLTALLLDAPQLPEAADGTFDIRVGDEVITLEVVAGRIAFAPEAAPMTTLELTMAGLRSLVSGSSASQVAEDGDVSIRGDQRAATALLDGLAGPTLLQGFRRRH